MRRRNECSGRVKVRKKEILAFGWDRETVTRAFNEPPWSTIKCFVNVRESREELATRTQRALDGVDEEVKWAIDRPTNDIGVLARM